MRRGRHTQKPQLKHVKCQSCLAGKCAECVDRLLLLAGRNSVCQCDRPNHEDLMMGEPRLKQIRDPFTDTVHAPGLKVSIEGDVKYNNEDL